jgi:hypothetical protein
MTVSNRVKTLARPIPESRRLVRYSTAVTRPRAPGAAGSW